MSLHPFPSKAWVVSVSMGYGHERAAYALRHLASGGIIHANDYPGIPAHDRKLWTDGRGFYETVSRFTSLPLVGSSIFGLMDRFQEIAPFYPRRDLSHPTLQVIQTYATIEKLGLCQHLIQKLSKKPLPLICTFFTPAFAAETFNYPGEIYLTVCDADMSRTWVARDPKKSRIRYFAPNGRVVERLKLYGVREENIFLTGFPLPKEMIGGENASTLKADLKKRITRLDPHSIFIDKYRATLTHELGNMSRGMEAGPPTLTFLVGGAGAQVGLGLTVLERLQRKIAEGMIRLRLVAGTRPEVAAQFIAHIRDLKLQRFLGKRLFVDHFERLDDYFTGLSTILRETDIIWTKPSEMSFYTGLGLPVIMAPSVGSQEKFNRTWLKSVGSGVAQGDPRYVDEWLFDWIGSGGLARMAWNGYIEAPTHGAYRIENIMTHNETHLPRLPLIV